MAALRSGHWPSEPGWRVYNFAAQRDGRAYKVCAPRHAKAAHALGAACAGPARYCALSAHRTCAMVATMPVTNVAASTT